MVETDTNRKVKTSSKGSPVRSFLIHAAVLLASLLFSLGLAEMVVRLAVKNPLPRKELPKVLLHEASPNMKMLYRPTPLAGGEAYGVPCRMNRLGFRDREFTVEKPKDTRRILFLGDSVVFGLGIRDEETLPKRLEAKFLENGRKAEVMNMGVCGYEAEQEIEFFKEAGRKLSPDLVIVGFTLNDNIYGSAEMSALHDEVNYMLEVPRKEWGRRFYRFLFEHSRLFAFLDERLRLQKKYNHFRTYRVKSIWHYIEDRNKANKDPLDSPYQKLAGPIREDGKRAGASEENLKKMLGMVGIGNDDFYSSHWNVSYRAFRELGDMAGQDGFKVAVVIFPYMIDMRHYALGSVHRFLREQFEGLGFTVIDLMDFVRDHYDRHDKRLDLEPIHFSAFGCDLIAEEIYARLNQTFEPATNLDLPTK
jgi:lysophospholipase L1-like esterase